MLKDKNKYQDSSMFHHLHILESKQLKYILYTSNLLYSKVYIRIVQRVPLYVEGQVQIPGLEHVPPFEHAGEQTAKIPPLHIRFVVIKCTYVSCNGFHYMLKDKCKYQDSSMFHHLNILESKQLKYLVLIFNLLQ